MSEYRKPVEDAVKVPLQREPIFSLISKNYSNSLPDETIGKREEKIKKYSDSDYSIDGLFEEPPDTPEYDSFPDQEKADEAMSTCLCMVDRGKKEKTVLIKSVGDEDGHYGSNYLDKIELFLDYLDRMLGKIDNMQDDKDLPVFYLSDFEVDEEPKKLYDLNHQGEEDKDEDDIILTFSTKETDEEPFKHEKPDLEEIIAA